MQKAVDEISFRKLYSDGNLLLLFLKSRWVKLMMACLIGGLLGLGYYFLQSPRYTAECTFVLDEKSGTGGSLASLASSFGVDISSMLGGGGSLFAYDNILDILQSRRIIETVLLSEVDTARNTHLTLADLYLDFSKLKRKLDKKTRTAGIHFYSYGNRKQLSLIQDSILYVIYKDVLKYNLLTDRTNKKTQIFKVDITSKSEYFSKLMAERITQETKNLYVNIKTSTTQKNIERLQQKADSLLILLNGKSYETAEIQVLNANPAMKTVNVPSKLASRNESIIGTLYTEVVKNLEMAKTNLMLQTPVIQILDEPTLPLENTKFGFFSLVAGLGFLSFFLTTLYFVIIYTVKHHLN